MPSKPRLKNTSIWAFEDIIAASQAARNDLRAAVVRAERHLDAVELAALARLGDVVAEIDRLAREARQGQYNVHNEVGRVSNPPRERQ